MITADKIIEILHARSNFYAQTLDNLCKEIPNDDVDCRKLIIAERLDTLSALLKEIIDASSEDC